jgi:release factor glutamine methyltransferase
MKNKQEMWTVLKVLEWTKGYLAEKGIGNARLETEWMLCSALGMDRVGLYVNYDKPLAPAELDFFRQMVARRAKREPLQYILGSQEFMGLEFEVSPAVLVPRYDTETLVEEALRRSAGVKRVLDVGVGSGCIAVSVAKALPDAEVFGVDISTLALKIAEKNAQRNGVNIRLFKGSMFEAVDGASFDMIVSNPPYIPSSDIATLQSEVRDFEPREALDGGTDGLDFYKNIIPQAASHLNHRGCLLFEVGVNQAPQVLQLFKKEGCYEELFTARDACGIDRVVGGRKIQ